MKKFLALFLFILSALLIFAKVEIRDDLFISSEELENFLVEDVKEEEKEFYSTMNIYLLTGGPGSLIWENFGHSTFIVQIPSYLSISYDYGIFTFDDTFIPSFIMGKLYYRVMGSYAEYRISSLEEDDRSVSLLKLNLTENEKKKVYSFLLYNTKPENSYYLYDYFFDNCATRLRDIYSWSTGGEFERILKATKNSESLRDTVNRHTSRSTFFASFLINYLLGESVDKESTMWDACFLPSILEEEIEKYQKNKSEIVYESQERKETPAKYNLTLNSLLFGLFLALLALSSYLTKHHHIFDALLSIIYLIFFIMSITLIFLSFFTIHNVTKNNLNFLIISPLTFFSFLFHALSIGKNRKEKALFITSIISLSVVLIIVLIRLILSSVLIQNIWAPACTMIILYLAEALSYLKKN